jgi:hypothetical protein
MSRIILTLAVVATVFGSAIGQQSNSNRQPAPKTAQEGNDKSQLAPRTHVNEGWPLPEWKIDTQSNPFVLRGRAVFVTVAPGVLIPVAGGGASGCLGIEPHSPAETPQTRFLIPSKDNSRPFLRYFHMTSILQ